MKLFIAKLNRTTSNRSLHDAFSPFGEVKSARVITYRGSSRSRGFGFVTFAREQDAVRAIEEMDGAVLDGREIRVQVAENKSDSGRKDGPSTAGKEEGQPPQKEGTTVAETSLEERSPSPIRERVPEQPPQPRENIRNFAIIAHIDHGKSTLADRLLDLTGALAEREKREQFLDNMDLERERGITIKAQTVRLDYTAGDGKPYVLNLIDTPGHVDFSYEVSRSLAACEGALLVVDAAQGVEAQTLANVYLAMDHELELIPVINKIDLPAANVAECAAEIEEVVGLSAQDCLPISAKLGTGVDAILEAIVERIKPPSGRASSPARALVIDCWFDAYRGVIALVRVFDGVLRTGQPIRLMATAVESEISEIAVNAPFPRVVEQLGYGEVGVIVSMLKNLEDVRIGDTITDALDPATHVTPLAGFKEVKPMVFAGLFPTDPNDYDSLRSALAKLKLSDGSLSFEAETSVALGYGFRCGFLGLLHMEIIQERLEREYALALITTAPTVAYRVRTRPSKGAEEGEILEIETPAKLPPMEQLEAIEEPFIKATIHVPSDYVGAVLALCEERRGQQSDMRFVGGRRVILEYELPLAEVLFDFFDKLKSCSRGYASLDYELIGYRTSDLVKLDILVDGESLDALSLITHRDWAYRYGKALVHKLKELIPRQQFEIPVQAAVGNRIIARESVRPFRKNVTAKLYGGDVTRKRKLLEKQKVGKKRMKQVGNVEIPQSAFHAVLKLGG